MGYEGEAGRTWAEAVHLLEPDGSARTRWVHRVINAASDPDLARAAREGRLNHDPASTDIALPFVYHDPVGAHFVLVVPEELRHLALEERSQLWERIASDTEAAVPRYVLDCPVVIGVAGLRLRLGLDPHEVTLAQKPGPSGETAEYRPGLEPADLDPRYSQSELRQRAREERLRRWSEELRAREERLRELERSLEARRRTPAPIESDAPISINPRAMDTASGEALFEESWEDDSGDVTGVRMTEPIPPPVGRRGTGETDVDDVIATPARTPTPIDPATPRVPDALVKGDARLVARLHLGDVLLFLRLDPEAEAALATSSPELLVQLGGDEHHPAVLLTVVIDRPEAPFVARAPLDVRDPDQRAVLTRLAMRYQALLLPVEDGGRTGAPVPLAAPREANVTLLLERLSRAPASEVAPAPDGLSMPPPVRLPGGHPFVAHPPAVSAREALDRVQQLAAWASPSRMDMALLVLSIPREQVDLGIGRVLADGRAYGIALPQELLGRSIAHGLVDDPRELVEALLATFARTVATADRGGITQGEVSANWERLLDLAARHRVTPSEETLSLAQAAIDRLRRLSDETVELGADALDTMTVADLIVLLEHPHAGTEAALALLGRRDASVLADVFAAVRRMPREEVLKVLPTLVLSGADAVDVLLEGLLARKTFVRQASAIALARLGSARSVDALLELLVKEPSEVWREVARVLPELGAAVIEALARAADDGMGEDARVAFAFAHLAARDQAEVVEAVAESATGRGSQLAARGLLQVDFARAHASEVRDEATLESDDRVLRFSAQLERALDGALPKAKRSTESIAPQL
jgi:hypothetical protein